MALATDHLLTVGPGGARTSERYRLSHLPLDTHSCQGEYGTDGRYTLHIVEKLAQEQPQRPAVGEQFHQLKKKKNTTQIQQKYICTVHV